MPLEYQTASVEAHHVSGSFCSSGVHEASSGLHWNMFAIEDPMPQPTTAARVAHVMILNFLSVKMRRYSKHIDALMADIPSL